MENPDLVGRPPDRQVDPNQQRLLTTPVKLAKPSSRAANRQGIKQVLRTDVRVDIRIAVDTFRRRNAVFQVLLGKKLGEVAMRNGVQLSLVGVRNQGLGVTWIDRLCNTNGCVGDVSGRNATANPITFKER